MKLTPKQIFTNSFENKAKLSPNGKYLAFIKPYLKYNNLWIKDLKTNQEKLITSQQIDDINEFSWKNNRYLVFLNPYNENSKNALFVCDIKTGIIVNVLNNFKSEIVGYDTLSHLDKSGYEKSINNKIIFFSNFDNRKIYNQYILNINSMRFVENFKFLENEFPFIGNQKPRLKLIYNKDLNPLYTYTVKEKEYDVNLITQNEKRIVLKTIPLLFEFKVIAKSNSNFVYVVTNIKNSDNYLYKADLKLANLELLFEKAIFNETQINFYKNELISISYSEENTWFHAVDYFNEFSASVEWEIKQSLTKQYDIPLSSFITIKQVNNNHYLITQSAPNSLIRLYLYNLKTNRFTRISVENLFLNEKTLVLPKYINSTNPYFTYYKKQKSTKKLDVIFYFEHFFHPSDTRFNPLIQSLTLAKKVVIVPNFNFDLRDFYEKDKINIDFFAKKVIDYIENIKYNLNIKYSNLTFTYNFFINSLYGHLLSPYLAKVESTNLLIFSQWFNFEKENQNSIINQSIYNYDSQKWFEGVKNARLLVFEDQPEDMEKMNIILDKTNTLKTANKDTKIVLFTKTGSQIQYKNNLISQFKIIIDKLDQKIVK